MTSLNHLIAYVLALVLLISPTHSLESEVSFCGSTTESPQGSAILFKAVLTSSKPDMFTIKTVRAVSFDPYRNPMKIRDEGVQTSRLPTDGPSTERWSFARLAKENLVASIACQEAPLDSEGRYPAVVKTLPRFRERILLHDCSSTWYDPFEYLYHDD